VGYEIDLPEEGDVIRVKLTGIPSAARTYHHAKDQLSGQ
jgi:hypothetical protein